MRALKRLLLFSSFCFPLHERIQQDIFAIPKNRSKGLLNYSVSSNYHDSFGFKIYRIILFFIIVVLTCIGSMKYQTRKTRCYPSMNVFLSSMFLRDLLDQQERNNMSNVVGALLRITSC